MRWNCYKTEMQPCCKHGSWTNLNDLSYPGSNGTNLLKITKPIFLKLIVEGKNNMPDHNDLPHQRICAVFPTNFKICCSTKVGHWKEPVKSPWHWEKA